MGVSWQWDMAFRYAAKRNIKANQVFCDCPAKGLGFCTGYSDDWRHQLGDIHISLQQSGLLHIAAEGWRAEKGKY